MAASNNPAARGILAGIRDAIDGAIDFGIESARKKSELWRLFYDSPLGSNLEKSAQKAVAVSVYKALIHYFPSLKEDTKTVTAVTRTVLLLSDRAKLMYMYRHGRISEAQFYDELGERYATTFLTALHRGEEMLTATLSSLLEQADVPRHVTQGALRMFFDHIEPSKEQSVRLVAEGLRRLDKIVDGVDKKITKALEPVRDFIEKEVVPWLERTGKKVKDKVKQFLKKR